ncbi:hypothetical protein OU798_22465 [Prolixibacteraceae bacterium Z1-6]|uniref:Uncharacterized protein n=1 Tax=Draconibacterium aestuarii TaxID=2998507 RepID=A0A9X3F9K9_9BACT|nr:hypothetical protein [Prolixibacteraceae bacterium Z1-6]
MQTIIENREIHTNEYSGKISFGNRDAAEDLRIVDYMKLTENGESVITLYSQQFFNNQIKVRLKGEKISLILTEFVDARRSAQAVFNTWEVLNKHSYTRIHNISIMLPGDNFYILRNYEVADDLLLKIVLSPMLDN